MSSFIGILVCAAIGWLVVTLIKKNGKNKMNPRPQHMEQKALDAAKSGKTAQQAQCLDYFYEQPGCMSSIISDEQYNSMVYARFNELNKQEIALEKLGIDIDQVDEIPPVNFYGFDLEKGPYVKQLSGKWVTPNYSLIWIFFSDTQIYIYECNFDMFSSGVHQSTQEYFYKDVTSFKTDTSTPKDIPNGADIRSEIFEIIVPGDKVSVSMSDTEENSSSIISAMKQKLREKKNS